MNAATAIAALVFAGGVVLVVLATERLLEGLVGIATILRVAPFAVSAVVSGMEAENVAVGLAAGSRGAAEVALGTVFGGSIFVVCMALGAGALIVPLRVRLPRRVLALFALAPLLAGLALIGDATPRWTGALLLLLFAASLAYLLRVSRHHTFMESEEVSEAVEKRRPLWAVIALTVAGIALITGGGELVASGATRLIADAGLGAGLVGMVLTPAAIEAEEIVRQVVPARAGRHDVSAGNVVGTLLWFTLANLGLIALVTPVRVPRLTRAVDWPFLVAASWLATAFLARGRVGRVAGAVLVALAVAYAILRGVIR